MAERCGIHPKGCPRGSSAMVYPDGRFCAAPLHSPHCHENHDGRCIHAYLFGAERASALNAASIAADDARA